MSEIVSDQPSADELVLLDPDLISRSWDQNYFIWHRNLQGSPYALMQEIRRIAELCHVNRKPFKILEVTRGIPLKALEISGPDFRRHGDMLEYGDILGKHPVPKFETTVVSPGDFLELFLRRPAEEDTRAHVIEMLKLVCASFDPDLITLLSRNKALAQDIAQGLYATAKRDRRMKHVRAEYSSLNTVVDNLAEQGNRYDLAFLDTVGMDDLPTFLRTVQKVLAEGGVAYAPITWWSPKLGGGTNSRVIFDRGVAEQLVADDPAHFMIAEFPGMAALLIKGSKATVEKPVQEKKEVLELLAPTPTSSYSAVAPPQQKPERSERSGTYDHMLKKIAEVSEEVHILKQQVAEAGKARSEAQKVRDQELSNDPYDQAAHFAAAEKLFSANKILSTAETNLDQKRMQLDDLCSLYKKLNTDLTR